MLVTQVLLIKLYNMKSYCRRISPFAKAGSANQAGSKPEMARPRKHWYNHYANDVDGVVWKSDPESRWSI